MSEGRGTTRPFELIGAPYLEAAAYARALNELDLAGVEFRACHFLPTFQKHAGQTCGGVQLHVSDREVFEPVLTGIAAIKVALDSHPEEFRWKEPPYEYVHDRNPFDVIAGTTRLREALESGFSLGEIQKSWEPALEGFKSAREKFLLY